MFRLQITGGLVSFLVQRGEKGHFFMSSKMEALHLLLVLCILSVGNTEQDDQIMINGSLNIYIQSCINIFVLELII